MGQHCPWSGMPCTCNDVEAMVNCEHSQSFEELEAELAQSWGRPEVPTIEQGEGPGEEYPDFHTEQSFRPEPALD
jgi:hypothetical protein